MVHGEKTILSYGIWNDIIKFITVGLVLHILLYTIDDFGELFDETTLKIFLYVILGLIVYHLVINKLVNKYFGQNEQVSVNNTSHNINNTTYTENMHNTHQFNQINHNNQNNQTKQPEKRKSTRKHKKNVSFDK